MNVQYTHMIWISQAAQPQNGYDIFGNGLKSEGNEGVIADVWTDYDG